MTGSRIPSFGATSAGHTLNFTFDGKPYTTKSVATFAVSPNGKHFFYATLLDTLNAVKSVFLSKATL